MRPALPVRNTLGFMGTTDSKVARGRLYARGPMRYHRPMTRRQLLALAAGALAAPAHARGAALDIVDSHQHLWDRTKVTVPWLEPGGALARDFLPADYAAATEGVAVAQAVYVEVDVAPGSRQAEADWVSELCAGGKTPTRAAVVGGRPAEAGFADYAKQFRDHAHVRGVRQVLQGGVPAGFCLTPAFVKGVQQLGEFGLSVDLCGPAGELANFAKLIETCPGTRFVLDHGGNPHADFADAARDAWKRDLARVAARPNVYCKLSGFVVNAGPPCPAAAQLKPYSDAILELFGASRVLFGGDWPVVTRVTPLRNWFALCGELLAGRSEAERARVWAGTAREAYRLPGGAP